MCHCVRVYSYMCGVCLFVHVPCSKKQTIFFTVHICHFLYPPPLCELCELCEISHAHNVTSCLSMCMWRYLPLCICKVISQLDPCKTSSFVHVRNLKIRTQWQSSTLELTCLSDNVCFFLCAWLISLCAYMHHLPLTILKKEKIRFESMRKFHTCIYFLSVVDKCTNN